MITRYDPKSLDKIWGASQARATIDGPRMALKGDVKDIDGEEHESIGNARSPQGDPERMSDRDRLDVIKSLKTPLEDASQGKKPMLKYRIDPDNPESGEFYRKTKKGFMGS